MPANITSVSYTFHDERRGAAEYNPPMKKCEVHLVAEVGPGEDGAAVLDTIAYIAVAKVRASLTIEGATAPQSQAALAPTATEATARSSEHAAASPPVDAPKPNIRRNADEIARGLTVEQAVAERAAKAAGSQTNVSGADATSSQPTADTTQLSGASTTQETPQAGADDWDAPVTVVAITDDEINKACATAADRIGDPVKVRNTKELFNPSPGQPFRAVEISQDKRADFLAKLAAL